jgi:hypothetical protein
MMTLPPVSLSSHVKLAVVFEVPDWLFRRLIGALGTIGVKTVEPVPASDASDSPMILTATI